MITIDQVADTKNKSDYPFLTTNLAHYFRSQNHPEGVVLAAPGVSFNKKYLGNHGGATQDEVIVPLLLRGAKLVSSEVLPGHSDLLKFLMGDK